MARGRVGLSAAPLPGRFGAKFLVSHHPRDLRVTTRSLRVYCSGMCTPTLPALLLQGETPRDSPSRQSALTRAPTPTQPAIGLPRGFTHSSASYHASSYRWNCFAAATPTGTCHRLTGGTWHVYCTELKIPIYLILFR